MHGLDPDGLSTPDIVQEIVDKDDPAPVDLEIAQDPLKTPRLRLAEAQLAGAVDAFKAFELFRVQPGPYFLMKVVGIGKNTEFEMLAH